MQVPRPAAKKTIAARVAKNLGYHFAKANQWNVCLYRKKEVVRFINEVIRDNYLLSN